MAITALAYGNGAGRYSWLDDTIKVAHMAATYTPDQDAHVFWSDISANEASGTGYTAGGQALSGKTISYNSATNDNRLRASASQWTSASFTSRYSVVYKDTGTAATSPLIGYVDWGGPETVTSGTFTITWDATNGVIKLTAT